MESDPESGLSSCPWYKYSHKPEKINIQYQHFKFLQVGFPEQLTASSSSEDQIVDTLGYHQAEAQEFLCNSMIYVIFLWLY